MPVVDFSNLNKITNKAYRPYYEDYRRYQVHKGGAGAGKSVFIAQKIDYNVVLNSGYNGLVIRNTGRDNHDSTFAELKKAINNFRMNSLFTFKESRGLEEIICNINKNKIVFRGLEDVEQVKSITFDTGDLVFIWIEEANEIAEEDFNQLDLRLRGLGGVPKHFYISFNPVDVDSWLKKRFFDNPIPPEDGFVLETTYKDNAFIDKKYKEILEGYKEKDYYFYQVYVLNQWGARTTARVFANIVIEDFAYKWEDLENHRQGIDFGFNHANAFIQCGFKDGELYITNECYAKNQLNKDFIEAIKASLERIYDVSCTADCAEPDKIAEFNQEGFCVNPAKKGPGSLMAGINYLKELPKIHIHKTNCPNAAREFVRMKYRELKDGRILDEVVEIDDDTVAATRYATEDLHTGEGQADVVFF